MQMRMAPNLGFNSFVEVAEHVLMAWSTVEESSGSMSWMDAFASELEAPSGFDEEAPVSRWAALEEDAQHVLRWSWRELGAETLAEALARWGEVDAPEDVAEAAKRLDQVLDVRTVNEPGWTQILDLPPAQLHILRQRIFPSGRRATLSELGHELGVTHERVRQMETSVQRTVEQRLRGDSGEGVRHLAARLARRIGHVTDRARLAHLVAEAVAATSEAPAVDQGVRQGMLLSLCGSLSEEGGLLWSAEGRGRLHAVKEALRGVPVGGAVDRTVLEGLLASLLVPEDLHDAVREELDLRWYGGTLMLWRGSLADKAVGVLAAHGEPMSMMELHEAVGFDHNPRSIAGQVQGDVRVMRRGKERYGLRDWGGEEYSGVLEELEQAIERAGGAADLAALVDQFVAEFGVSANSVRTYAADRRFVRNDDGSISLRTGAHPEVVYKRRPIEDTLGAFLLEGIWHLRIQVDEDVLRGSGRPIRRAVAMAAGLEPDLTIGAEYEEGTVTFSWSGTQPNLGSVRSLVSSHSCVEGDLLFLPLEGPEPRPSRVVRSNERLSEAGLRRLALEMGLPAVHHDEEDALSVATALGLPAGADWDDVADRLRDRGERDLVAHLPAAWL
jgi:hypothetical protein